MASSRRTVVIFASKALFVEVKKSSSNVHKKENKKSTHSKVLQKEEVALDPKNSL